jgi:hypothetical protein
MRAKKRELVSSHDDFKKVIEPLIKKGRGKHTERIHSV